MARRTWLSMATARLPQALAWLKSFFQVSKHFSIHHH
jgi:hypothetical protein